MKNVRHVARAVAPALGLHATVALCVATALYAVVACNPKPKENPDNEKSGDESPATENPAGTNAGTAATGSVGANSQAPSLPAGPPGKVVGTIRVTGDAPPTIESIAPDIPVGKCFLAHETYSKLFREGAGRTLADVLVAVTDYRGEVEKPAEDVVLEARDCAYDTRTVVLYKGQTLAIKNVGKVAQMPQLVGHPSQAVLVAIPGGEPIEITPLKLGQYQLIDRSHPHVFTDVFVLSYPSFDVTGLDGQYEIAGLPPGKAKLSALLPITGQTVDKQIEIPPGGTVRVDLSFEFDNDKHGEKARAQRKGPDATPSSAAPAPPSAPVNP